MQVLRVIVDRVVQIFTKPDCQLKIGISGIEHHVLQAIFFNVSVDHGVVSHKHMLKLESCEDKSNAKNH